MTGVVIVLVILGCLFTLVGKRLLDAVKILIRSTSR